MLKSPLNIYSNMEPKDTAATSEGAGAGGCEGAAEEALKLTNEYRYLKTKHEYRLNCKINSRKGGIFFFFRGP